MSLPAQKSQQIPSTCGGKQSSKSLVLWFLAHFISKYPPPPYVIHFCFNSKICCSVNISWERWVRAIKWKPITEKENMYLQIEIFKEKMTSHQRGATKIIVSLISPTSLFWIDTLIFLLKTNKQKHYTSKEVKSPQTSLFWKIKF